MSNDRASRGEGLSAAGAARREEILGALHGRLDARVRRRKMARAGIGGAAMLVLVAAVWSAIPGPSTGGAPAVDAPIAHRTPEAVDTHEAAANVNEVVAVAASRVTVRIVSTPHLEAAPCENSPGASVCLLNDEQLLAALAEAGHPSGLVRIGDRAVIVPQDRRAAELD